MKEKRPGRTPISRRDMIRIGAAVASCTALCSGILPAESQASTKKPAQAPPSVFQDDCRDDNKTKYKDGDLPVLGGLLAMWLMLTTDEWSTCLKDQRWRSRLAVELKLEPKHLEFLYGMATSSEVIKNDAMNYRYTNLEAFTHIRKNWQDFIDDPPEPKTVAYGKRPCPGGKTLLKIANEL
jgi:hypothetical protein